MRTSCELTVKLTPGFETFVQQHTCFAPEFKEPLLLGFMKEGKSSDLNSYKPRIEIDYSSEKNEISKVNYIYIYLPKKRMYKTKDNKIRNVSRH